MTLPAVEAIIPTIPEIIIPADAAPIKTTDLNIPASAHHWYSYFLVSNQRSDEALAKIKRTRELAGSLNISVNTDLGEIYSWAGRYNEAETHLRDVLQIEPNYAVVHHVIAINLLKQIALAKPFLKLKLPGGWKANREFWLSSLLLMQGAGNGKKH
jgi:tetratricopeptide (TPR) repeat protein